MLLKEKLNIWYLFLGTLVFVKFQGFFHHLPGKKYISYLLYCKFLSTIELWESQLTYLKLKLLAMQVTLLSTLCLIHVHLQILVSYTQI